MGKHGARVVLLSAWRQRAQADRAAALMCGANALTVARPGDVVSPEATFRSVWNGTPESAASTCNCDGASGESASRTSSGLGTVSFIKTKLTDFGTLCLPLSVRAAEYAPDMGKPTAKEILMDNVKLLMTSAYGGVNISRFGQDTGLSNGGTQRVLDPAADVRTEQLTKIADFFKIEIWQLLAPNLGQAMLLSPAELDAVRKMREPQQPKPIQSKAIKTEHIETKAIKSPISKRKAG